MKINKGVFLLGFLICFNQSFGQEEAKEDKTSFAGLHVGIVQPLLATNKGNTSNIGDKGFFAIGFPMGITFNIKGDLLFDMEFVPFVNPGKGSSGTDNGSPSEPNVTHLLLHPGVLKPLGNGFTFGVRAAFELGMGQYGFTPLLNKAFKLKNGGAFFAELVLPGRFGPATNSGYTQVVALHFGFGF